MTLKDIIQIQEITPRAAVSGTTRENIFPYDRLIIEGVFYAVKRIHTNEDGTKSFVANIYGRNSAWNFNLKTCN